MSIRIRHQIVIKRNDKENENNKNDSKIISVHEHFLCACFLNDLITWYRLQIHLMHLSCCFQIFLKDELEIFLDKRRDKELREVAKVIKRCIIGYLARKRFLEKRAAIMLIQKVYKVRNITNDCLLKHQRCHGD